MKKKHLTENLGVPRLNSLSVQVTNISWLCWPLFYVMRKILFLKILFYSYLMKSDEKPLRPLWVFRLWFSCHNGQLFTTCRNFLCTKQGPSFMVQNWKILFVYPYKKIYVVIEFSCFTLISFSFLVISVVAVVEFYNMADKVKQIFASKWAFNEGLFCIL